MLEQGLAPDIGIWIDGSMPMRAQTIQGYITGMHAGWLGDRLLHRAGLTLPTPVSVETRYRYNPDVKSLQAMVPAVIPILLLMIPAVLAALAVVREKEMGSIINLYVTPLTKAEFLLGKQLPYVVFSSFSAILLLIFSRSLFAIPVKGSLPGLIGALILYCVYRPEWGCWASS